MCKHCDAADKYSEAQRCRNRLHRNRTRRDPEQPSSGKVVRWRKQPPQETFSGTTLAAVEDHANNGLQIPTSRLTIKNVSATERLRRLPAVHEVLDLLPEALAR